MENKNLNKLGIDIGSTTVKIAVLGKITSCCLQTTKDILPISVKP